MTTQWALFRVGHAHAGVWVVLSLVIQVLLDAAAALKLTGLPPPSLVCWTGATAIWLPHRVPKPLHQALQ